MAEKKINLNEGHRERVRQRYIANGLNGFQPHEILELLLFYVKPRCDTNKVAHELVNRFHTLAGVMNADIQELCQVKGVGMQTAIFLHLFPDVFRAYQMSINSEKISFEKMKDLKAFIASLYVGIVKEQAYVICFDSETNVICVEPIGSGTPTSSSIDVRSIVETAIRNRSDCIALAHNHPDGNSNPSSADIFATERLIKSLSSLDITLIDHFIVGKRVTSMTELGYINN